MPDRMNRQHPDADTLLWINLTSKLKIALTDLFKELKLVESDMTRFNVQLWILGELHIITEMMVKIYSLFEKLESFGENFPESLSLGLLHDAHKTFLSMCHRSYGLEKKLLQDRVRPELIGSYWKFTRSTPNIFDLFRRLSN